MPQKDPQKRREYMQDWRRRNPDRVRANSLKDQDRQKEYRHSHKAEYAEYQRQSRERNPQQHMVTDARARAKRYGVPATITIADINWVSHCPVFGTELVYGRTGGEGGRPNSATLDRKINALGYVPGNVFVLSHRANRLKQDATVEEVEALLKYMKT